MTPAPPTTISSERLLVVEGKDEENFFRAVFLHLCLDPIQILPIGGKTQLLANLKALCAVPNFSVVRALGIVRDADDNAKAAFESVRGAVRSAGLAAPAAHAGFGDGQPAVGVFIVPDGSSDGVLEILCLKSAVGAAGFDCVGSYFDCLQASGRKLPAELPKAQAHAWLAAQALPDKRVGEAALAGYWDFTHAAFAPLWAFLGRLSDLS